MPHKPTFYKSSVVLLAAMMCLLYTPLTWPQELKEAVKVMQISFAYKKVGPPLSQAFYRFY